MFWIEFSGRIWRLLIYACLAGQVYASKVTGVWLNALCPLPSSPGSSRGPSGGKIKTQFVTSMSLSEEVSLYYHKDDCSIGVAALQCFYYLVPSWVDNYVGHGVGLLFVAGRRSRVVFLCPCLRSAGCNI